MTSLPDILPLAPYLREIVWGGRRLQRYGKALPPDVPIGESFEVSALPGQQSTVASHPVSGALAGEALGDLLARFGADLAGPDVIARYGDEFPLLIKLIDAQDDLSIQVHPDDAYARAEGLGRYGKTEAWFVLHSAGARLALGLPPDSDEVSLRQALEQGRGEEAVLYQEVAAGDTVFLRAGTVHALCRGVMVYEVQQASDLTFRLYDYNRPGLDGKPRELHIDRGLAVTDFARPAPSPQPSPDPGPGGARLVDVDEFTLTLHGDATTSLSTAGACAAITVVEGSATVGGVALATGQTALIPPGRSLDVRAEGPGLRLLEAVPGC
jgi:mannose-6-phosphate isomerase